MFDVERNGRRVVLRFSSEAENVTRLWTRPAASRAGARRGISPAFTCFFASCCSMRSSTATVEFRIGV